MFDELSRTAQKFLQKKGGGDAAISWQYPREEHRGDLATSLPLSLAKKLKAKPMDIAEELAKSLAEVEGVERAEAMAPGYVNVWVQSSVLVAGISRLQKEYNHEADGRRNKEKQPVIVEYSQPNIAKPLGVHHILSTVIGQVIANLYGAAGFPVIRWNYIGDWGTQFGKLAVAFERWGSGKPAKEYSVDELLALYVRFHDEAKGDASLEEKAREAFRKLETGDKKLKAFWADVVSVTKASLGQVYRRLHVSFDTDMGESFYQDKMDSILEEGKKKGVFTPGEEGAVIVQFPPDTNMPPYLVQKGDGATLYSTRDLAQMRYRIDTYNPSAIYIVTDIAQKLHFEQLETTCGMLEWKLPVFENIIFGRMRFADKEMSTRKGNILRLEEVLDEAVRRAKDIIEERGETIQTDDPEDLAEMMGIGAVVYGILSQNRKMDMVFDWDKMLSFEGNSAPYAQYTHARARSVLRKADGEEGAAPGEDLPLAASERLLARTLLQYPLVLEEARTLHFPHKLTNFLFQLCQDFNAFYNAEPILKAEGPSRRLRLHLTTLTADVLKSGAEILTLRVPDRM